MIEFPITLTSGGSVCLPGHAFALALGYTKNRGVYRLHVDATGEWEGLAIRCFWHVPDGKDPASSLVMDGYVAVPASVTAQPGSGCITFEGSGGTKTVTSADLRYRVSANSGTADGTMPEPGTPAWQELVDTVQTVATAAEQAKTDAQTAAQQAGQALSDTISAKEDALKAIGDRQTAATRAVDAARDKALQQVEASTEAAQTAASEAATSAGDADRSAQEAADSLKELKDGIASGDFKGDPGPIGPVGPQGEQGPQGPKGETGPAVAVDPTLSIEGKAADAKATGDAVSQLKEDLIQCEEYAGIEYPEIEPVEGKYYLKTSQASSNSLSHSQILVLHKNDKIVIECCAYLTLKNTIPALVRFDSIDSTRPNGILVEGGYEYETYSYTATGETYVAFNWRNETGYKVKIYRYQWETVDVLKDGYNILTDFVEVSPGYIQSSTGNATGTNKKHTELFALRYGETIEIDASGYTNGTVSILHRYDSDGLNLGPVYAPEESGQKVYCYTETKAIGYYKASSYSEILVIKKYSSPEGIRETICNTKAYERDYLKLLFENAIFIGDSLTRGVLGTTGGINNRISYPYYVGKMTGWNITNAGHGGYTTIKFWENDLKTLDFTDKDVCFVFLGQNGGFTDTLEDDTTISGNQTYEDYAETNTGCYCKIIEYIKEQNPNIHIFMLMGAGKNATTVLPQIAEKYHLPCLNIYKNQYFFMMNRKVYHPYKSDGVSRDLVHFGKIGYIDLAKSVLNMTFDYIAEHFEDYEYPYPS